MLLPILGTEFLPILGTTFLTNLWPEVPVNVNLGADFCQFRGPSFANFGDRFFDKAVARGPCYCESRGRLLPISGTAFLTKLWPEVPVIVTQGQLLPISGPEFCQFRGPSFANFGDHVFDKAVARGPCYCESRARLLPI